MNIKNYLVQLKFTLCILPITKSCYKLMNYTLTYEETVFVCTMMTGINLCDRSIASESCDNVESNLKLCVEAMNQNSGENINV